MGRGASRAIPVPLCQLGKGTGKGKGTTIGRCSAVPALQPTIIRAATREEEEEKEWDRLRGSHCSSPRSSSFAWWAWARAKARACRGAAKVVRRSWRVERRSVGCSSQEQLTPWVVLITCPCPCPCPRSKKGKAPANASSQASQTPFPFPIPIPLP